MRAAYQCLLLAAWLSLASAVDAHAQPGTPEEFRRLYSYVQNADISYNPVIPANLARLLGWKGSRSMPAWRRGFAQRRTSDGALLRQYTVDIFPRDAPGPYLLLTQIVPGDTTVSDVVPGDTTVSFLFNNAGAIVRAFEIFPDRNHAVEEVRGGQYDELGYDVWRFAIGRIPESHR
jgi:hypothetical protein